MPTFTIFNPLDEHTCDYCRGQVGKPESELDLEYGEPPFLDCEDDHGCRCYLAIERSE